MMKIRFMRPRQSPGVDALRLHDVDAHHGGPLILRGVHLRVPAGTIATIQGRSGCGKSTLLAVAGGMHEPSKGKVELADGDGEPTAFIGQHPHLIDELTVLENVVLPMQLAKVNKRQRQERARRLLARFGIEELANRHPDTLSGGERARVGIARALTGKPRVLLVDEPTAHLGEEDARSVMEALQEAATAGSAVVIATHDPMLATMGTTYRMLNGRPVRA